MTLSIDSGAVAKGFSAAANQYERWAEPQRRAAEALLQFLPEKLPEGLILDIGCGTGLLTARLHARYPQARLLGVDIAPGMLQACRARWRTEPPLEFVEADAGHFVPEGPCALIGSNCTFQWLPDPAGAIRRLASALVPGGCLALAVPIQGTLGELAASYWASAGKALPGLAYRSEETYMQATQAAGLAIRTAEVEEIECLYESARQVLRSLKGIGATFQGHPGYVPLRAARLAGLLSHYESTFAKPNGQVPATYRVLFMIGEKPS